MIRSKLKTIPVLCFSLIGLSILIHCHMDSGLKPLPGKFTVEVAFLGDPPENTEGIYLVVMPQFPPQAINQLYHSPNSLALNQDTVTTEMYLPYGDYEAYCLWWYSTESESNLADVLALPVSAEFENGEIVIEPVGFSISEETPEVFTKLTADWDKVRRNAVIEGTITFNGDFPANTYATAIGAYVSEPTDPIHYLTLLKTIDIGVGDDSRNYNDKNKTYEYKLPIRNGVVRYLAVFWMPEQAALTDFYSVGVYMDPENPNEHGVLDISENETLTGIDIQVDWSLIEDKIE